VKPATIRNSRIAPNTAPNEMLKSPMRIPSVTFLIASNRSDAATSSGRAPGRDDEDEQRTHDARCELADEADAARLDAELTRELAAARRVGRKRAADHRVGDDQQQIGVAISVMVKHHAPGDEGRKARVTGEQRNADRRDRDPGEQPHPRNAAARFLLLGLAAGRSADEPAARR